MWILLHVGVCDAVLLVGYLQDAWYLCHLRI